MTHTEDQCIHSKPKLYSINLTKSDLEPVRFRTDSKALPFTLSWRLCFIQSCSPHTQLFDEIILKFWLHRNILSMNVPRCCHMNFHSCNFFVPFLQYRSLIKATISALIYLIKSHIYFDGADIYGISYILHLSIQAYS